MRAFAERAAALRCSRSTSPRHRAAMQQVHLAAPRSASFMALLFLPAAAARVLAGRAALGRPDARPDLLIGGSVAYLVEVVGVTVVFHVPRNDALAPDPQTQHEHWEAWLRAWMWGNHVRAVSGLAAAGLLALSLHR